VSSLSFVGASQARSFFANCQQLFASYWKEFDVDEWFANGFDDLFRALGNDPLNDDTYTAEKLRIAVGHIQGYVRTTMQVSLPDVEHLDVNQIITTILPILSEAHQSVAQQQDDLHAAFIGIFVEGLRYLQAIKTAGKYLDVPPAMLRYLHICMKPFCQLHFDVHI
jgi:hypothetical protein